MGLGAAQLWRSCVPASAPSAGTGREGRKRRKSRNGCMVSTGFPVPPQEPELHQVQTAPAPGGRQHQPHGGDLTAHSGWRGCAPQGAGGERGPLCRAGGGVSALALCGVEGCARGRPAPHRDVPQHPPAPAVPLLWGRAPCDHGWDQFGSQQPPWSRRCWDTSRLGTFLWGSAPCSPPAIFPPVSWFLGAPWSQCARLPLPWAQG